MKNSISIVLIIILITQILGILIPIKTYATAEEREGIKSCGDMMRSGKTFLEVGEDDAIDKENLAKVNRAIYNSFLTVAIGIAVIVGAYLGIKIMTGTIEEKAKTKEMLVPYIVGVVVIFAVFPIWDFVVQTGTDTVGTGAKWSRFTEGKGVIIPTQDINLYAHSNCDSNDIICIVPKDSRCNIVSYIGNRACYEVEYKGKFGYIFANDPIIIKS